MGRYLTERLCNHGGDRALLFCTPHTPSVLGGRDDNDADSVANGLSSSGDGSLAALTLRWLLASLWPSGRRGGGEEACGTPGGGVEYDDRGRKVQGGVDEAHRGQEEEEGGSVGGRDRDGVPGAWSELERGGRWRRPGTGRLLSGCHPVVFRRGRGVSSPAPRQLL
jgi:hypothetical protein